MIGAVFVAIHRRTGDHIQAIFRRDRRNLLETVQGVIGAHAVGNMGYQPDIMIELIDAGIFFVMR